jgi:hypothetical protein
VFARLELRAGGLFLGGGLLRPNLDVLVARQDGASFLPLAVSERSAALTGLEALEAEQDLLYRRYVQSGWILMDPDVDANLAAAAFQNRGDKFRMNERVDAGDKEGRGNFMTIEYFE